MHLGVPGEDDGGVGYTAALTTNPTRDIMSALSLPRWLSGLCERDQTMLAPRQAGHTLTEIVLRLCASTTAVCARLRGLGAQLLLLVGGMS